MPRVLKEFDQNMQYQDKLTDQQSDVLNTKTDTLRARYDVANSEILKRRHESR